MEVHDHIVVGSGCAGAMAAQTLVESGARVTLLDVGLEDDKYSTLIPAGNFLHLRETDEEQHRYLLGDELEAMQEDAIGTGAQLTPPRMHMARRILDAVRSETFFPMESFAYGGLGAGWGLGCCQFSPAELKLCGLEVKRMQDAYKVMMVRIGVSGLNDDAAPYTCGTLDGLMPPVTTDNNGTALGKRYEKRRRKLRERGFYFGRPSLALLTEDRGERKKYAYRDLDFYSDEEQSAYRPWITVNELKKKNGFRYENGIAVLRFEESGEGITVHAYDISKKAPVSFRCKKLFLAPGVLQTGRIILRSLGGKKLPLLCNPYCYIPSVQWAMLGKQLGERSMGFAQWSMFHDEDRTHTDVAMASVYSYHSLMMFRVIRQVPLNYRDARTLMQYLMPAFTIFGIHHPERPGPEKFIELETDASSLTGDQLKAVYRLSSEEQVLVRAREKKYMKAIRLLGCFPIRRIDPGMGSSIHYAGTLPFNSHGERFTLSPEGRLNGTRNIFVADASGFAYLPAKGLTFSLMANAHNVALAALQHE